MALEHYHRYMFCSKYVNNKKVLDIACGTGYGAELMSYSANKVTGADIDPVTIQYCNALYKKKNLQFDVMSVDKINYPQKSFDIITCFETIEHISEEQQKTAISQFAHVLKEDGILFISTPSTSSPLHIKDNKYHIHELSHNEFYKLLSTQFKYVNIIGQSICLSSVIGNCDNQTHIFTQNKDHKVENCKYLIAICSNSDISNIETSSIYIDNTSHFLRKLTKIRNKIGCMINLYNFFIKTITILCPIKKLKKQIEKLKW